MTEPSKWAQELAGTVMLCTLDRDTRRNIAFLLDTARYRALEEAARCADTVTCGFCGMDSKSGLEIRALIDQEPTP